MFGFDRNRYLLRMTWRRRWPGDPDESAIASLALALRQLGFAVTPICRGADHGSFRLCPREGTELPLGHALARLHDAELELAGCFPGEWELSVELPCPRRTAALDRLAPACVAA
jgi:hypothetical protein